jgi:hypothetical protein
MCAIAIGWPLISTSSTRKLRCDRFTSPRSERVRAVLGLADFPAGTVLVDEIGDMSVPAVEPGEPGVGVEDVPNQSQPEILRRNTSKIPLYK